MSDRLCYKSMVPLYEFFIKNALLSINLEILSRIAQVTHALHVKISSHKSPRDLLSHAGGAAISRSCNLIGQNG